MQFCGLCHSFVFPKKKKKASTKKVLPNTFKIWDAAKIQPVTYQNLFIVPIFTNQQFSLLSSTFINGFSLAQV